MFCLMQNSKSNAKQYIVTGGHNVKLPENATTMLSIGAMALFETSLPKNLMGLSAGNVRATAFSCSSLTRIMDYLGAEKLGAAILGARVAENNARLPHQLLRPLLSVGSEPVEAGLRVKGERTG